MCLPSKVLLGVELLGNLPGKPPRKACELQTQAEKGSDPQHSGALLELPLLLNLTQIRSLF